MTNVMNRFIRILVISSWGGLAFFSVYLGLYQILLVIEAYVWGPFSFLGISSVELYKAASILFSLVSILIALVPLREKVKVQSRANKSSPKN